MPTTIAAQYVFTNTGAPIKNGAVTYDESTGEILEIKPLTSETANTAYYNGVLAPGFVNAHCHLELAYAKGLVPPCRQLTDFLQQIHKIQKTLTFSLGDCINADREMYLDGINVVGDISNTAESAPVKSKSKILYYNFIELLGTTDGRIAQNRDTYHKVAAAFAAGGQQHICAVPHSPYFVSEAQFDDINSLNANAKSIVSIHNQETKAENELYVSHSGSFVDIFPSMVGSIPTTGQKSLPSYGHHLAGYGNVLLVHNTYSTRDDLQYAIDTFRNPYFVLCPKSNLYLEGRLPDVALMNSMNLTLCLGTDSLSSNDTLSILEEMKVLAKNFKQLPFDELLKMATINGARALSLENGYGILAPGRRPGLLLLENFDFHHFNISDETTVRRIC